MADSVTRSLLIAEAKKRGWNIETLGPAAYYCKVTLPDGRWDLLRGSRPLRSSANGFVIAKYKNLTMDFARSLGYEVPPHAIPANEAEALEFLSQYQKIVVKPVDGHQSQGVTVSVQQEDRLRGAMAEAKAHSHSNRVVLQQQLRGKLYRLFILDGRLIAAALRKAPEVIGDGMHTVRQLIETLNSDPRRSDGSSTPLKRVSLAGAEQFLGQKKLSTVPTPGKVVRVSALASVSTGGEASNVTDFVHADWQRVAGEVAQKAGLFVCGFDIMCDDIAQPLRGNYVPILEMNSSPGFKLHQYPTGGGEPVIIAPILFNALFP